MLALLLAVLAWTGCATSPGTERYRTYYLGPDGSILGGEPRPPQRGAARDRGGSQVFTAPQPQWSWNPDGASGPASIEINLTEQKAYFKRGGRIVGISDVSTGREGYRTPTGRFQITQKSRNHISNLYGDYVDSNGNVVVANVGVRRDRRPPGTRFRGAPMPYFMRIHGGVGLHAGFLPGFPDSSGCIRLPEQAASLFFANAQHGTPVRVTY